MARCRRLDERIQVLQQRGMVGGRPLAPRARLSDPLARSGVSQSSSRSPRLSVAGERPVGAGHHGDAAAARGLALPSPPN